MEVTKAGANTFTGSKLTQTAGTLTYAGTLNASLASGTIALGDSIPLFAVSGTGAFANTPGFTSVTAPNAPTGLSTNVTQLTSGTGGNITYPGIIVPALSYANASGTSRQITLTEIQTAGLASSQSSPTYTISLPSATSALSGSVITDGSRILYTPSSTKCSTNGL